MSGLIRTARIPPAVLAVVTAGVAAALHVGKLPPALPALQATLRVGLLEAGFLLSLVQLGGMLLGLVAGLAADAIGLRRSMLAGLALLTVASLAGGAVGASAHPVGWLLAARTVEGAGFLLAAMPGPGLIRRLAPAGTEKAAMGLWGAYMPLGVAVALLVGPWLIGHGGWVVWWQAVAGLSALALVLLWRCVPPDEPGTVPLSAEPAPSWCARTGATVSAPGPRLLAGAFGVYSAQWMAVIGFLPTVYAGAGMGAGATAALTAFTAALNMVGNVWGGRCLQSGWAPARLLRLGFLAMAVASVAAFAQLGQGADARALPPAARYLAVCLFSLGGGVVPATLFMLAARMAPGAQTVTTTVGLIQQASSLGQFIAPPVVAWVAHRAGGWHWTWTCTLACSLAGLALAARVAEHTRPSIP